MSVRLFAISIDGHRRFVREGAVPWQGLGQALDPKLVAEGSSVDLCTQAGWGWGIATAPACIYPEGHAAPSFGEGLFGIYRTDTARVLGWSGPRWRPFQPAQLFDVARACMPALDVVWTRAGTHRDGEVLWLLGKIEDPIQIGADVLHKRVILLAANDGHTPAARIIPAWFVASSATLLLLEDARALRLFPLEDPGRLLTLVERACAAAVVQFREAEGVLGLAQQTAEMPEIVEHARRAALPVGGQRHTQQKLVAAFTERFSEGLGQGARSRPWAFLHAIADSVDHVFPVSEHQAGTDMQMKRFVEGLNGPYDRMKRSAYAILRSYLNV